MRRPPAPTNTRNGLKWRDGRPRWEPSPANRAIGIRGLDLKDLEDRWIAERGLAIAICDSRTLWAQMFREARQEGQEGQEAAAALRQALEALTQPQEPEKRLRRALVQDLLDLARRQLDGQDAAIGAPLVRGVRTVERLVEAFTEAVDTGRVKIKPRTRTAYFAQRQPFLARFAGRGVGSLRRAELIAWYDELLKVETTANANMRLAGAGAFLKYAWDQEWIPASPAQKLGLQKAKGRRVFWTLEEEQAFVPWCDAHGYPDVADGVTSGLWTGARISDLCALDLDELADRQSWRFVPIKTEKGGQEAMPGITGAFRARLERRTAAAAGDQVRHLNATPFLWHPEQQRRHTPDSYWRRYVKARAEALAAEAVPDTLAGKNQQDTRDTCITRLWLAGVDPARMWTWTGHSKDDVEAILREHYLVLVEAGQLEMAKQLEAWAQQQKVSL